MTPRPFDRTDICLERCLHDGVAVYDRLVRARQRAECTLTAKLLRGLQKVSDGDAGCDVYLFRDLIGIFVPGVRAVAAACHRQIRLSDGRLAEQHLLHPEPNARELVVPFEGRMKAHPLRTRLGVPVLMIVRM